MTSTAAAATGVIAHIKAVELDGWAGGDESLLSLGRGAEVVLGALSPPG